MWRQFLTQISLILESSLLALLSLNNFLLIPERMLVRFWEERASRFFISDKLNFKRINNDIFCSMSFNWYSSLPILSIKWTSTRRWSPSTATKSSSPAPSSTCCTCCWRIAVRFSRASNWWKPFGATSLSATAPSMWTSPDCARNSVPTPKTSPIGRGSGTILMENKINDSESSKKFVFHYIFMKFWKFFSKNIFFLEDFCRTEFFSSLCTRCQPVVGGHQTFG